MEAEAHAAAAEAGSIGGRAPEDEDPAERPVAEAGGGVAEGFEQAEAELIEQAEHGDAHDPAADGYVVEAEAGRVGGEAGEADHVKSATEEEPV